MNVALVYDRVNKFGGAEQVLLNLHQVWPRAPLFTSVYQARNAGWAKIFPQLIPSFLQSFPLAKNHHELYPWLTPLAFESFDFAGFDLVISVTSAEAKAVITQPRTKHVCYCLTPTRYLWSHQKEYLAESGLGFWLKTLQPYLQKNDLVYAQRPDVYVAISKTVQKRIQKYYRRDSIVIYPPVDTQKFFCPVSPAEDNYFLIVSRLVRYKRVDLAIKAFNKMKTNLVIVGKGRERARLKQLAGPTIKFTGWVGDEQLIGLYQHCRALIMPQEEDFGIAAVEVQAAGRPVIALDRGGAQETVINRQTGILYTNSTVDSLIGAVKQFEGLDWKPKILKAQAQKFDKEIFLKQWLKLR